MARRVGFGEDGGERPQAKKSRLLPAIFLTVWLVLWAAGMFYVGAALLGETGAESGLGSFAMVIWLAVAVVGWLLGLRALRRILRGEPALRRNPNPSRRRPHPRERISDPSDPDAE